MPAAGGQWVGVPRERASFAECERGRRGRRVRRLVSPPPHSPCARSKSPPLPTHCTLNVDSAALRGPGLRKGAAHAGGAGWRGPGHMGVRAVGAPVLSRREGPLGVGVRLLSACELAARSGTRGGEGEYRLAR